jgi:hypothetical protein
MYQQVSGSCGYGGFLGALIGLAAVVFTGGIGLALIGGALAGFVVGTLTSPTSPGLKAYESDAMFDQNSTYELLVTDATYYNIDGASGIDDSIDYDNLIFNYSTLTNTYWEHSSVEGPDGSSIVDTINIYWNGALVTLYNTVSQFATNYTDANGDTYIRGELRDSSTITTYNNLVGNFVTFSDKYSIARVAIGDEPSGDASDDNDDDVDDGSFVPDDIPEIYEGVAQWKGGTFSGSTWWTTYYSGATLTEANARMFIWYAGSIAYGDFTGAYTSLNTTSVTGNDGRTYFKGAPHPEDGNPYDNGSFKYLFHGVGRE